MSEFRWDPLKRSWSITANHRERHPREFFVDRQRVTMTACPFCPGREDRTPPEIFAVRGPADAGELSKWRVRVVPNKFPLLRIEGELERHPEGLYQAMQGIGAHEVIIETPQHDKSLADLDLKQLTSIFQVYRQRLLDLRLDKRFRYLQIFKNHGIEAGAPLPHPHSQLLALPITPPRVKVALNACRDYYQTQQQCLICALIAQDRADGRRIVYEDEHFIVVAPYASISPFELRLFPLRHNHDFALETDLALTQFAAALRDTLQRLRSLLRDPPYNFILHTAPPPHPRPDRPEDWVSLPDDFHWYLEMVPRLKRIAGFEWGSGVFINIMPAEDAARHLRSTQATAWL